MKKIVSCLLLLICLLAIAVYGQPADSQALQKALADKTFVCENVEDIFNSDFTLVLHEDGSFRYSPWVLSSYIGLGEWNLEGNVLVLTEDEEFCYPLVHRFKVEDGALVFLAEASDPFPEVGFADGERLDIKQEQENFN